MTDYSSLKLVPRSWLVQSKHDLDAATANAEDGRHALACFLAQQSAEKAVVAFLYNHGAEHVWGHALSDLCADAIAFDQSFEFVKSIAGLLDKHYDRRTIPADANWRRTMRNPRGTRLRARVRDRARRLRRRRKPTWITLNSPTRDGSGF